jgi:predicted nucleotidyltransferase
MKIMTKNYFYYLSDLILAIQPHLEELDIDHFIVGAVSRDLALSINKEFESKRKTEDVDIAIRISNIHQFETLAQRLKDSGEFTEVSKNPIKLIFREAIEIDLLPFGDLENELREVHIPMPARPFVLRVPGLKEVQEHIQEYKLPNGKLIYYCPLEGIVLLKLVSWYEKPERTKDAKDIEHICHVYFDYSGDDIYLLSGELMNQYDESDYNYKTYVASHYLGRKVREIIKENPLLLQIINRKLEKTEGIFRALLDGINDSPENLN